MTCRTNSILRTASFKVNWKFNEQSSSRLKHTTAKSAGGIRNKRLKLA